MSLYLKLLLQVVAAACTLMLRFHSLYFSHSSSFDYSSILEALTSELDALISIR